MDVCMHVYMYVRMYDHLTALSWPTYLPTLPTYLQLNNFVAAYSAVRHAELRYIRDEVSSEFAYTQKYVGR